LVKTPLQSSIVQLVLTEVILVCDLPPLIALVPAGCVTFEQAHAVFTGVKALPGSLVLYGVPNSAGIRYHFPVLVSVVIACGVASEHAHAELAAAVEALPVTRVLYQIAASGGGAISGVTMADDESAADDEVAAEASAGLENAITDAAIGAKIIIRRKLRLILMPDRTYTFTYSSPEV
jgi:hypothetical protein